MARSPLAWFQRRCLRLPGHGASASATSPWSFDRVADDLAYFAKELGLSNALFVGHSTGGLIGLVTAARYPGLFAGYGLLATAPAVAGRSLPPEAVPTFELYGRDRTVMETVFTQMYLRPTEVMSAALDDVGLIEPGSIALSWSILLNFGSPIIWRKFVIL
ncbi:alpha/beta fold hydrolase [Sphingomonas sediminicola]|uniref:Alpha/beta fold hydrolase n=1 Tax=Sphingomonas sediminicola TaxID=386874 RepID=A0ABX6TC03_9SPHN|nr:alpha/beta fold hydrolase [Sphingomonas sediminicola]QNP46889.1 alpha/beta fold hydrolase [Sphingomonas sediminicola]